ncbi:hypothetical protein ABEB36_001367 [Hypothenemus hampei]|uniref:glutathione transferase n=1 Tax=Hypothenemus hampei TaxID=57062 RepID=A0ABD1FG65_HYPHA
MRMAPQYKLTYFDVKGLGESIRYLLSYGGLEFEDVRVEKDDWPAMKDSTPLSQLPILEVDGKVLFQSVAIAAYLGEVIGISGSNALENWEINAVSDTLNDFKFKLFSWRFEQNETKKAADKETLLKETLPFYVGKFEQWVKSNKGYLAIGKLTWIDILFVAIVDVFDDFFAKEWGLQSLLDEYPNLQAHRKKILEIPRIQEWRTKHP